MSKNLFFCEVIITFDAFFPKINKGLDAFPEKLSSSCGCPFFDCVYDSIVVGKLLSPQILLLEAQRNENLMVLGQGYMEDETALSSQTWSHILWSLDSRVAWHCRVARRVFSSSPIQRGQF